MRHAAIPLALLALSVGAPAQQAPPAPPPSAVGVGGSLPVEAFAGLPFMEAPRLSPDGTRIAAKVAVKGQQRLVVLPLTNSGGKPAVMGVGEAMDINWWRWVGDGWLAVGVGAESKLYGTDIYVTRLVGVNAGMTKVNRIDWDRSGIRADDVIWAARDGSPRVLLSRQTGISDPTEIYPQVAEVDLSTGKARVSVPSRTDVYGWFADAAGEVRMGYRLDDDRGRRELLYRDAGERQFRTVAVRKRNDDDAMPIPLVFRADNSAVAIADGEGYDGVYEMALPSLTIGKRLFATRGYDVDGVIASAAGNDLAGVTVTEAFGRTEWFDPALREIQAAADKAVGGRRARIVSWSADRTMLLLEVGGPSEAGALYYWDTASDRMQKIAWLSDALKGRRLSPVSTIRYPARDGTSIEAVLTMPRLRDGQRNLPLIVMPHGGPFARDAEGWDWWSQYLAELGYVVIQPNYRGSSGYGTAFARAGEGQWGLKMQDDLDDAITWAAAKGIADAGRVCMVGASYGGYAAMRAAQRAGGAPYRCAVSYAGVSDLAAMREYDSRFLGGGMRGAWLKRQAPDFRAVSPRFGAAAFGTPILLVHGKMDRRVPVRQSRMMADALKAAGKPVDYVEQPLGDHHFTRAEDRLDFLTRMAAFLRRHNPA